jgi:transposase
MERAVQRGLRRRRAELVSEIGVDEKAFRKGQSYLTLVNDLIRGRVLYVAEDRKQSSLDGFWETLTAEQICGICAVAHEHLKFLCMPLEARFRQRLTFRREFHDPRPSITWASFADNQPESLEPVDCGGHRATG